MKTKINLLGIITIILVVIFYLSAHSEKRHTDKIRVCKLKYDSLQITYSVFGMIVPANKQYIFTDLTGRIKKLVVDNGAWVEKGQLLLQLTNNTEQENVLKAKQNVLDSRHQYFLAENNLRRIRSLHTIGQLPEKDLEFVQNDLAQKKDKLENDLELLKLYEKRIEQSNVRAPLAGTIIFEDELEQGLFLPANSHIFSIVEIDSFFIQAFINQDYGNKIICGQQVRIYPFFMSENADSSFSGTIVFVAPEIRKGLQKIRIKPDEICDFHLGTSLQVDIPITSSERKLTVPIEAVNTVNDSHFILTINNGKVKQHAVQVAENNSTMIAIECQDTLESSLVITSHIDDLCVGETLEDSDLIIEE
ncbi:efflux RND transporter periplasmic adaptor subunit [candidate division KSB1 bacterium]|nr:efflux RND transporter periplasmic adaptor subunit [candidate division KSB1 bacterium]